MRVIVRFRLVVGRIKVRVTMVVSFYRLTPVQVGGVVVVPMILRLVRMRVVMLVIVGVGVLVRVNDIPMPVWMGMGMRMRVPVLVVVRVTVSRRALRLLLVVRHGGLR